MPLPQQDQIKIAIWKT